MIETTYMSEQRERERKQRNRDIALNIIICAAILAVGVWGFLMMAQAL